ncbi:MAG: UUP1 family membrane protein, partial [Alphaproteobacteria bacterium]|nr:UUP1 family membrane protein [Alphaproteobacteria bacterium]
MMKFPKTIRPYLIIGLILSFIFAGYSAWYKYTHWGFTFSTNNKTSVWTIEEHISFIPTSNDVKLSLAIPTLDDTFKVMN